MAITFNSGYDNSPHKKANPIERGTVYSGTAMSFDGTNDYINIGNVHNFSTGNFSISCRVEQTADSRGTVIAKGTYNGVGDWLIYDASTSDGTSEKLFFRSDDNDGDDSVDLTSGSIAGSGWHHLVVTRSGTTLKGYDNGVLIDTATFESNYDFTNTHDLNIGARADGSQRFWSGSISNVQIWNTVLTLAQIQEMYKQPELILPTGITSSSLRGHWLLNEGSGVTAYDSHIPSGEKKFGETSIVFDGTGDYLELADNNDFDFQGTEDFTMEAWVYMSSKISGENPILLKSQGDANVNYYLFIAGDENKLKLSWYNGSSWTEVASSAGTWNTDTWYHIAAVRNGSDISIYRDGVSLATNSSNPSLPEADGSTLQIGMPYDQSGTWNGYIDDIRITKGLAVYTGAFTAPTAALTTTWDEGTGIAANADASKVVLLIHGDNSKNRPATGIVDSSPSSHTITVEGGAKLTDYRSPGTVTGATWDTGNNEVYQTALVKGRGAMMFDTGDVVDLGSLADFGLTGTACTISLWATVDDWTTGENFYHATTSSGWNDGLGMYVSHGGDKKVSFWVNHQNPSSGYPAEAQSQEGLNHYVGVYDGAKVYLYVNGVKTTGASLTASITQPSNNLKLGTGLGWRDFSGFEDEFAIWDTALSASQITTLYNNGIPYAATNIQSSNLKGYWRNDGVGTWSDRSTRTSFGTSAIYFDGDDDLEFAHNSGIEFGADPFTLEMNIRLDSGFGNEAFMSIHGGTMADRMFQWERYSNKFSFYAYDSEDTGGVYYINDAWTPNANQWYHLAMVRNGADVKFYIDGTQFGSIYNIGSASMADGGYPLKIGVATNTSNGEYSHFTGYMDGIRISKGVARYTSNFTKPSEPFVSDANTSFLLNGSVLTDESSNSISITNSGDTSIVSNLDTTFANDGTVSGSPSIRFLPEGTTAGKDTLSFPLADTTADVLSLHDPAYFEIPQNADFAFGAKDFTVEFWINIKELETGVLIGNTWEVHTRKGWSLYWNKSDTSLYLSWSNTTSSGWDGDYGKSWTPDLNTWIHFHLVRSGDTFTFYENNSVITSSFTDSDSLPTELTKPFRIGADPDDTAANFFNASFDEVRVYHKALSSAERIQNYNHGAVAHGKTVIEE